MYTAVPLSLIFFLKILIYPLSPILIILLDSTDEDELKKMPLVLPIPIPVPIYVPFPVCLYARPVPYAIPYPLPCPVPIPLVFDATPETPHVEGKILSISLLSMVLFTFHLNSDRAWLCTPRVGVLLRSTFSRFTSKLNVFCVLQGCKEQRARESGREKNKSKTVSR